MGFGGKIRRLQADKHMSDACRAAAGFVCFRCEKDYSERKQGIQLSHFIGRGNWAVRFDPKNVLVLCAACHQHVESHPVDHINLWRERFGSIYGRESSDAELNALLGRSVCKERAQYARANHSKIGKHFLAERKRIEADDTEVEHEVFPPIYRATPPYCS